MSEAALPIVRERVERLLDSDPKKRVYEAIAEGTATVSSVEKGTGVWKVPEGRIMEIPRVLFKDVDSMPIGGVDAGR